MMEVVFLCFMARQKSPEDRFLEILQKSKLNDKDWEEIKKERGD